MVTKKINIAGVLLSKTNKAPIPNARIEAWDKDMLIDDFVGEAVSDKQGRFSITFTHKHFQELFADQSPDIYFKVYNGDQLICSTENSVVWNIENGDDNLQILVETMGHIPAVSKPLTGVITHVNGNPVAGITVQLKLKSLRSEKVIAETVTNAKGRYSFTVDVSNNGFVVAAVDDKGKVLSASDTIFPSVEKTSADLIIQDDRYRGEAYFQQRGTILKSFLTELNGAGENKNLSYEDLKFISKKTNQHPVEIWRWMTASQLAEESSIDAEAFYGLFSQGLPAHTTWLSYVDSNEFKSALKQAAKAGHVSEAVADRADTIAAAWDDFVVQKSLTDKHPKLEGTMGDMLEIAGLDQPTQKQVLSAYLKNDKNVNDFWAGLEKITGNKKTVLKLQRTIQLATLTGNQPAMTEALLKKVADSTSDNPLKDLARMDESEWAGLIQQTSGAIKKSAVPAFILGDSEEERIKTYSIILTKTLQNLFPTQAFFSSLGKEQNGAFKETRNDLLAFEKNNPSFELKQTSFLAMKADDTSFNFSGIKDKESLIGDLMAVQRLTTYSNDYKVVSALKSDGLDSGYQIAKMNESTFVSQYKSLLGSEQAAQKTYQKAVNNYAKAAAVYAKLAPNLNNGTAATPSAPLAVTADPTLRTMFGTLDQCETEHCTSVLSPAAYLADILNFLYKRAKPCYDELIRRRPDLIKIELNCENTETPLPYVDLVNELLENMVLESNTVYQTTWTAQELAANPEHLRYTAYDKLKNEAVFPHNLPFNLPLEEARVYLKHLGAERLSLMTAFYPGTLSEPFSSADIAHERLGLSKQEAQIINGTTTGDGGATTGIWNFFGFDKSTGFKPISDPLDSSKAVSGGTWNQVLTARVDLFLQQTDLVYKDLISLLICDTLNPVTNATSGARKITITAKATDADGQPVAPDTCELNLLEINGASSDDLHKISRFVRLWKKLKCSMFDLDRALKIFGMNDLRPLAQLHYLSAELNLPLEALMPLYANIDRTAYTDYFSEGYPEVPSLYNKLFLNKSVITPLDAAFTAVPLAGTMIGHTDTILAALQISAEDYALLTTGPDKVLINSDLTDANLRTLYSHALLARSLGYSIRSFLSLKKLLSSINPFADALSTIKFLQKVDAIRTSGFSLDEINYLLCHRYQAETAVAPEDEVISDFLSQLRTSLRAIKSSSEEEHKNTIVQKFSEKLAISATASRLLLQEFLKGIADNTLPMVNDFWAANFSSLDFLRRYPDENPGSTEKQPKFVRSGAVAGTDQVAVAHLFQAYVKLDKTATIINKLKLSDTDLKNILTNSGAYGCTDLKALPLTEVAGNVDQFEKLVNLIRARDLMPLGSPDYFDILFKAIDTTSPSKQDWIDRLQKRTNWDKASIEFIVGQASVTANAGMLKTNFPADFKNGDLILRIRRGLDVMTRVGIDTGVLEASVAADVVSATSVAIKNAAKAKYDERQWAKIARPLRNELREKQREALVAYAIARPKTSAHQYWGNSNELYAWLLIDVEMKPISMTSRIKQAICSVQLFVDRVLLNLEHKNTNPDDVMLTLGGDQVAEWEQWRKIYRVWEANRKIFLYPENWIEPELRDDKSPFFKELEAYLLQNELSDENVEDAFHQYLEKLDGVSRLEVVGVYHQLENATATEESVDIVHVIARTYSNPHLYYHRTLENSEWTSWKKLEIDIDGNHIIPTIFNRRLCLFWLFWTQEQEESSSLNPQASSIDAPPRYWKIQIAWSEFKKNKWTAKKLSRGYFESKHFTAAQVQNHYAFKTEMGLRTFLDTDLRLHISLNPSDAMYAPVEGLTTAMYNGSFVFRDTGSDPEIADEILDFDYSWLAEVNSDYQEGFLTNLNRNSGVTIREQKLGTSSSGGMIGYVVNQKILGKSANGTYKLPIPLDEKLPFERQFFFQDTKNTFYVTRSIVSVPEFFYNPDEVTIGGWVNGINEIYEDLTLFDVVDNPVDWMGPVINPARDYIDQGENFRELTQMELAGGTSLNAVAFENVKPRNGTNGTMTQPMMLRTNGSTSPNGHDRNGYAMNGSAAAYTGGSEMNYYKDTRKKYTGSWGRVETKYHDEERFTFETFYHAHVKTFVRNLNKHGVEGLLKRSVQTLPDTINFGSSQVYDPTSVVTKPYPVNKVDFKFGGAYAQYNWELFFHVPMLIACRLSSDQRFKEAREWFHYIFNPTNSEGGGKERFWQFKPFYDEAGKKIQTLNDLLHDQDELVKQIDKWMADPFKPHVIARMRISAYMKNVVMKYLDNIIAWADQLFRRDTIESINEATNLYVMCAEILGDKPDNIPPRATHADMDFDDLKDDLDPFSNAMVEIETFISPSAGSSSGAGSAHALGEMFYFSIPRNENLMKYWDTVADRLFKIRHSMNIEGVVRTLPLFEPPIDPAMLVRAAAAGIDLNSLLSDISSSLPHYRFNMMLQKANELCNDVKSLGAALLAALEKKDGEAISLLRSTHEQKLLKAVLSVREKQVDDAKETLEGMRKSLEIAQLKLTYYNSRQFMNGFEQQHLTSMQIGMVLSAVQGGINMIGGVLSAIPNIKVGVPTSMGATFGGDNLGAIMGAVSNYIGIMAGVNSAAGSMASTLGGYTRRMDDWRFQGSSAQKEIAQIEKQIAAAEIKVAIAEKELANQELQIENATEMDDFMRSKFTNKQLYEWMIGQISTVYFQSYQLAYDLAKKAQKCYEYELGEYNHASFVQFGYWDSLKKGLLSAERLQYDLRRMESAYLLNNKRELELTKHVSVMLTHPQAIADLRKNGKCTVVIPEALFDMDYPGHYFRRLKSVSLTIPCVAGPYSTVNCTLRLIKHVTRLESTGAYACSDYSADTRFRFDSTVVQAMATSSAQNDSGLFEVNFRDERYLPFEGCGAFGEWQIELQENENLRVFDYNTVSDVILGLKYTARDGGGDAADTATFKGKAVKYLTDTLKATVPPADDLDAPATLKTGLALWRMFSLRHEFPSEWHKMFHPIGGGTQQMDFSIQKERFPFFVQERTVRIKKVHVYGFFSTNDDYTAAITSHGATVNISLLESTQHKGSNTGSLPSVFALGDFTLTLKKGLVDAPESEIKDLILVLEYELPS